MILRLLKSENLKIRRFLAVLERKQSETQKCVSTKKRALLVLQFIPSLSRIVCELYRRSSRRRSSTSKFDQSFQNSPHGGHQGQPNTSILVKWSTKVPFYDRCPLINILPFFQRITLIGLVGGVILLQWERKRFLYIFNFRQMLLSVELPSKLLSVIFAMFRAIQTLSRTQIA